MAFNRKKQLFAPDVEGLIKELTGFEEDERNFQEVSKYFYQNIIHHTFATIDFSSVQRSLEGIVDKLSLHGLKSRGKRLKELMDRYVSLNLSDQSQLQWNVLLLLLRLSHKPTSVPEELLKPIDKLDLTVKEEEEDINWYEHLREGWEDFLCPDEDSDVWSEEEEEEEDNPADDKCLKLPSDANPSISLLPSYMGIPHPNLWRLQSPTLTRREAVRSIVREAVKSKQWLQSSVQHSWWEDPSWRSVPESKFHISHTCYIWERNKSKSQADSPPYQLQVISEYKLLKEVLWMLQIPTNTSIFHLNDQGSFCIRDNVSLPSLVPETLHLVLADICPYFNMLHELKEFQDTINQLEQTDCPAPLTFKAYCAQLAHQLYGFNEVIVDVETRLNKQEETMTLLSVEEELRLHLKGLQYLYNIHTRATRSWQVDPPWVQVTRLLSVLYEAFLEANDHKSLEASLSLFVHSFHVYLDIIDIWLSEGRLEDWRKEFLVMKKGDCLEVMPYEEEMCKQGVIPVTLLTELVKVVKDAGYTLEIVSQLNKLTDLRDTVLNKGCLFNEFLKNVSTELYRLKEMTIHKSFLKEENNVVAVEESNKAKSEETSNELKPTNITLEYSVIQAGDGVLREHEPPVHLSMVSAKVLYGQTMKGLLSNPLLAEALKDYFQPNVLPQSPPKSESGLHLHSLTLMGVACLHKVLETQVELVESRHKVASSLVIQVLCNEYNLLQHLTVLRNVFFMESGIFAQRFYSYLFKEVGQWRNRVNLSVHLQDCVEELFPGFHSCFSVQIDRTQAADQVQQAIQSISIAYMVDWPVTLIITDEAIDGYNKVFRFLLHIKYAFWILQDIRFSDLSTSPNVLRVKRLQALKMWMYFSTNSLHSYFMGLVLRCYSNHLDESVQQATSLKDIIKAHHKYMTEVKTHCLQMKKSHLETFIKNLLWLCQDLADLWLLEADGNLTDAEVRGLEQKYLGAYMGLTYCLEAITSEVDDEVNPLWELKAEFQNSIPQVWEGEAPVSIN